MGKRHKWTEAEDEALCNLLGDAKTSEVDWTEVASEMVKQGFRKNKKQILDRWSNILNPEVNNRDFTAQDYRKLFSLQGALKSKWRLVASHFPGKTDNFIKNKFFSMTRKALRLASKLLQNRNSTKRINSFRPKTITWMMDQVFPDSAHPLDRVTFRDVIVRLVEQSKSSPGTTPAASDMSVVGYFLAQLEKINAEYRENAKGARKLSRNRRHQRSFKSLGSDEENSNRLNTDSSLQKFSKIANPLDCFQNFGQKHPPLDNEIKSETLTRPSIESQSPSLKTDAGIAKCFAPGVLVKTSENGSLFSEITFPEREDSDSKLIVCSVTKRKGEYFFPKEVGSHPSKIECISSVLDSSGHSKQQTNLLKEDRPTDFYQKKDLEGSFQGNSTVNHSKVVSYSKYEEFRPLKI